jgi:hypothetical protein
VDAERWRLIPTAHRKARRENRMSMRPQRIGAEAPSYHYLGHVMIEDVELPGLLLQRPV